MHSGAFPPPQLTVTELDAETLRFKDTRSCAVSREVTLCGLTAHLYRLADDPVDEARLSAQLADKGIKASLKALRNAVAEIGAARLALSRSDVIVSLATPEKPTKPMLQSKGREATEESFSRYLAKIAHQIEHVSVPYG